MITCKCKHEFLEVMRSQPSLLKHYFTCILCIIEYIIFVISYGHLENFLHCFTSDILGVLLVYWIQQGMINSVPYSTTYIYFISQLLLNAKKYFENTKLCVCKLFKFIQLQNCSQSLNEIRKKCFIWFDTISPSIIWWGFNLCYYRYIKVVLI